MMQIYCFFAKNEEKLKKVKRLQGGKEKDKRKKTMVERLQGYKVKIKHNRTKTKVESQLSSNSRLKS